MGTSPDVGGRSGLGKPLIPERYEQEATAQVQIGKIGLGITPNTLEIPLLGDSEIKRYESPATRPSLRGKVLEGIIYPETNKSSLLEKQNYENLVKDLSYNLHSELNRQKRLPVEEQDPSYLVFERILRFAAKAMTWKEMLQYIEVADHAKSISRNRSLVKKQLRNWIKTANTVVNMKGGSFKNRAEIRLTKEILIPLIDKTREVIKTKKKTTVIELRDLTEELIKKFHKKEFALQLTGALLETLLPPVTALLHQEPAPCLALLMVLPMTTKKSEIGCFRENSQKVLEQFTQGLPESYSKDAPLLIAVTQLITLFFSGVVIEAGGIAIATEKETRTRSNERILEARGLAFRLASALVTSSDFVRSISHSVLSCFPWYRAPLAEGIHLLALNALFLAGVKGDKEMKAAEIVGMKGAFQKSLKKIKKCKEVSHAVRHGSLALKNEKMKETLEVVRDLLEQYEIPMNGMTMECEHSLEWNISILHACHRLSAQGKFVSVINQAA